MYQMSQLYFYRPLFMLQLLVAEFLFMINLKRRNFFWLRFTASILCCFGSSFAIPIVEFNTFYGSVIFMIMFAVTLAAMAFMYEESFKNIMFCCVAGFTVQHVAQELYELFNSALGLTGGASLDFYGSGMNEISSADEFLFPASYWFSLVIYVQIFFLTYCLANELFAKKIKKSEILQMGNKTIILIAGLFMFIDIVFGAVIIWSLPDNVDSFSVSMLHIFNILCCVFALVMLFEIPRRKRAENELAMVSHLQHREREQYLTSKENVEMINLKCHDLKHHVRTLQKSDIASRSELAELEKIIDIYDVTYTTDNEALNIILMEKSLICKKESINLSCIIDAEKLDFIAETDIYSLFGNMLDNAITAVRQLDSDKRSIGLSVRRVRNFITINAYNGYESELQFVNGLPVTTKKNKNYHGFGLKSIRRIVEKYNGSMRISTQKQIFDIKIMFPAINPDPEKDIVN